MNDKGLMIVVSGFSGAGKGTIVSELKKRYGYKVSVSATTRKPREGEIEGVHYYYLENETFEKMIDNDELMEHAGYVDNYYGTPKKYVLDSINSGEDIILEIEMQGALQIREKFPEAVLIFITAPGFYELKKRLEKRGTESAEVVKKRLKRSADECAYLDKYDYIVVNDDLDVTVEQVHQIISSVHLNGEHQRKLIADLTRQFNEEISRLNLT